MSLPTSANLSLSQINSCMRFTNGNVGIGTTAPAYKLDIVGNVNATSLLKSGAALTSTSTFNAMVTYNSTATLTTTSPTDVEVSGQIGDVTIALPANNTSGNIITVHNVGGTTGSASSGVFVRTGVSSTSGSIARIRPGESVTTIALQTAGTTPKAYQKMIVRKGGNGSQWTERAIPNTRNWLSVTWAPELGLFCAVDYGSAAFVMTSPDGITWTERAITGARQWSSMTWAPELGLFCAVNSNSAAVVMTSADGITWTERAIPTARAWWNICWAPEIGLFCAVNLGSAAFVMTSPDGITWTERAIPNTRNWSSVCWASELGLFCAVNNGSAAFVMTSSNGINWTERSIPATRSYRSVCWSPQLGLFCAVNTSHGVVMTSPNGVTWTERAIPNTRNWLSVTWAPELGLFCAVNSNSAAVVMTSADGITWTERSIPTARGWYTITWSPELMTFCVITSGAAVCMTSFGAPLNLQTPVATSMGSTSSLTTNTVTYTLSSYFRDYTGTGLTYSLTANPQSSASILNGILSVTGNYRNTSYTVTVTATNGIGKTATSSLTVNEAPVPAPTSTSMGSTSSLTTNTVQYTLSNYFTGLNMTYTLTANPQSSASISSGILSVTGNYRATSYTVTVQATNAGGSATSSLTVNEATPPAPTSTSMGSTSSLTNNTVQYTLSNYFTGFNLTYDFTVNSYGATISNGILSVTGNYRYESYTVTVRATNAGGSATSSLTVNETYATYSISFTSSLSQNISCKSIASGGIYTIAVGNGNVINRRVYGGNWSGVATPATVNYDLRDIAYSNTNGVFCAVGWGHNVVLTTTDGYSWTTNSLGGTTLNLVAVVYANGVFGAITGNNSSNTNRVAFSSNGTSWTLYTTPSFSENTSGWKDIAYASGVWCAIGDNCAMTSSDGVNWTNRSSGVPSRLWRFITTNNNNVFVAVSPANYIMWSTNGINWNEVALPSSSYQPAGITYDSSLGIYCIIRIDGTICTAKNASSTSFWVNQGSSLANGLYSGGIALEPYTGQFITPSTLSTHCLNIYKNN